MGLIWNTGPTQDLINTLKVEFAANGTSTAPDGTVFSPAIGRWRAIAADFGTKQLATIAAEQNIFAGGAAGTPSDKRWQFWLQKLSNANHKALSQQIHDALLDTGIDEILFAVVPKAKGHAVSVEAPEDVEYDAGIITRVITVRTPTADQVKAMIRARARAKNKAAKKKAAKKKKR
jgi:hypothetical protein